MLYSLALTVLTMTGSHNFNSALTFPTLEACLAYGEDTRSVLDGKYIRGVRYKCKALRASR